MRFANLCVPCTAIVQNLVFLRGFPSRFSGINLAGKVFSGRGPDFGSGDCPAEAPRVIELSDSNGATRSPRPGTQSPRRRSPEQYCHRVMASDGASLVPTCIFGQRSHLRFPCYRAVAQLGSALEWGSRGRGFESRRPERSGYRLFSGIPAALRKSRKSLPQILIPSSQHAKPNSPSAWVVPNAG